MYAYSSHERSSNENQNQVLRRFIPKDQAIETLGERQLVYRSIRRWIWDHLNALIGIYQSRSSCLISVTKFVQIIFYKLPFNKGLKR